MRGHDRPALGSELTLDVAGRAVRVSSLSRLLWPAAGVTKAELIDYYVRIAPVLLPHLAGRPLTLRRFPEGVGGPEFFQTRTPPHPPWVRTATMTFPRTGKTFAAPVLDDLAGLVWAANLSAIELHPFLARAERLDEPLVVVLDLDPGPPADVLDAAEIALQTRGLLEEMGLAAVPKTSGAKGIHVYVPLNTPVTYQQTKSFAREIARVLTRDPAGRVVDRMTKALRPGRVFVDWSQNDPGKSTVAPYSLRALGLPSVSTPLGWPELERAVRRRDAGLLAFHPGAIAERVDRLGDLFAPVLELRQHLPSLA